MTSWAKGIICIWTTSTAVAVNIFNVICICFTHSCVPNTIGCQPFDAERPIASAQISSRFSFLYGRVEVRAKLPNANWVFPQIFLQPTDNVYGSDNYASGQMRIAHSAAGESMIGGVLLGSEPPFRLLKMCRYNGQWSGEFHIFSLRWMPGKLSQIRCLQLKCADTTGEMWFF